MDVTGRVRVPLQRFIEREVGSPVSLLTLSRLPGGTMRHAWALDVDISSGPVAGVHRLIYLQDRGGAPLSGRLRREAEFQLLVVMHECGVRVPKPYWQVRADDSTGIEPGMILERVDGETVASRLLRDRAFDGVRPGLLEQIGEELARIHAVRNGGLGCLPQPVDQKTPAESQLAELDRTLGETGEPHPALELGLRWLQRRAPTSERIVLVHGDYRLGNFIVDPAHGLRAVLDWELSHLGDPGEDLGWLCIRFWRCVDGPGLGGLGPRQRFFQAYEAISGWRVDPELAVYWEVFANLRWALVTLRQAQRHLSGSDRSLELASIGRRCAEVEWELLRLLRYR